MAIAARIRIPAERKLEFYELHRLWWSQASKQNPDVSSATVEGPASFDGWETIKVDARLLGELRAKGFPFKEI
jgi:hypothetical protein